jgi:hypothetical protein
VESRLLGITVRIHAWPLAGFTYIGVRSLRSLRWRLWLAILAGPATNAGLVWLAVIYWKPLIVTFGKDLVFLWIASNALHAVLNSIPFRFVRAGRRYQSDGMQLVNLPFKKPSELAIYLINIPLTIAAMHFQDANFVSASKKSTGIFSY